MGKIFVGGFLFLGGLITLLTIILCGTLYIAVADVPGDYQVWHAIFGKFQDEIPVQPLDLGFPFLAGVLITLAGFFILGYEFLKSLGKHQ